MRACAEFYVCPGDHGETRATDSGLRCTRCGLDFGFSSGVLDLDIVKRPEREAFDERFRGTDTMSEAERAASLSLASRFAAALGHEVRRGARVLDVACGNGALTYGLLTGGTLSDADLFCFDHSVESMRVFLNTASQATTTNRLHPSIQDVQRLAYPERFFDAVLGNAVLHHFLEYEAVLEQVRRILKPGGTAIFAEPVGYGYLWATFLMRLAARYAREQAGRGSPGAVRRLAGLVRRRASAEGLGRLDFFTNDTFFRLEHHDDGDRLAALTDKHYFLYDEVANLAARLGFRIRFAPYEPAGYYAGFMRDMLTTYGVADRAVVSEAEALYASLLESLPTSLHRLVSHFHFLVFEKAADASGRAAAPERDPGAPG